MKLKADKASFYHWCFYLVLLVLVGTQQSWAVQHIHLAEQHAHDGLEHEHQAVAHPAHISSAEHALQHLRVVELELNSYLSKCDKHKHPSLSPLQTLAIVLAAAQPLVLRAQATVNPKPRLTPHLIPLPRAPPLA